MAPSSDLPWSETSFMETVSKKGRGRPRKHLRLHAFGTATGGNPHRGESLRSNANGHYAMIAFRHLQTLDPDLAWVWKSQVVRTELGRVIELAGPEAATDLVHQIAHAHPERTVNAHDVAQGIRAGQLAAQKARIA